jgi:hypothetical protein
MKSNCTIIAGSAVGVRLHHARAAEVILKRFGFVRDQVRHEVPSSRPGGQQLHPGLWGATAVEKGNSTNKLPHSRLGELYTLLRSLFSDIVVNAISLKVSPNCRQSVIIPPCGRATVF